MATVLLLLVACTSAVAFPVYSSSNGSVLVNTAFNSSLHLSAGSGTIVASSLFSADGGIGLNGTRLDEAYLQGVSGSLSTMSDAVGMLQNKVDALEEAMQTLSAPAPPSSLTPGPMLASPGLPAPTPPPPTPPGWSGPFTCCSGQASCGGAVNDPVVCAALGDLYYATNGAGWNNNGGWSSAAAGVPTDYCGFWVVEAGGCSVLHSLTLQINHLSGTIPSSLSLITSLTQINFGINLLSGTIPVSLSSISRLQYLIFADNQLIGTLPGELFSLTTLLDLNVYKNELSGTIPDVISHLTSLYYLCAA